jgi:putative restriction endonuclease
MMKLTHRSEIKISRFYEEILGVKLKNPAWSWGAIDLASNRVFLSVWNDRVKKDGNGEKVHVLWKEKEKSHGYPERRKHLEAIQHGATGIGILCETVDLNTNKTRKIKTFDDQQLLLLGNLSDEDESQYARIIKRFPISELADSTLVADIKKIISNKTTDPTTVQALVNARVGQGKFGLDVRKLWNHRCSVTGSSTKAALEASHIQSWADSNDIQRLDPNNGLLLTANLHKLFDAGLISFEDSGKMLVSSKLSESEQEIFGVIGKKLSKKPSAEIAHYLSYHRDKFLATHIKPKSM